MFSKLIPWKKRNESGNALSIHKNDDPITVLRRDFDNLLTRFWDDGGLGSWDRGSMFRSSVDIDESVELQYVRAGKLLTVKATLGEQTKKEVIVSKWPGLGAKLQVPWSPIRPEFWTEAHDRAGDGTEWTSFESMSVEKHEDGAYVVRVTYKDTSGNSISKEFKGTRQEIRDAINDDHDLPDSRKQQLTRTLDDRGQSPLMQRDWQNWNRELFNWPNVDF